MSEAWFNLPCVSLFPPTRADPRVRNTHRRHPRPPQVDWISYDGWGMHVPEGYFRFETGPDSFVEELRRLGGEEDVRAWWDREWGRLGSSSAMPSVVYPYDTSSWDLMQLRPLMLLIVPIPLSVLLFVCSFGLHLFNRWFTHLSIHFARSFLFSSSCTRAFMNSFISFS